VPEISKIEAFKADHVARHEERKSLPSPVGELSIAKRPTREECANLRDSIAFAQDRFG
jgi:hypothetical protein